tara:strand:- start:54 stop:230 length:177 start_codon:yes stop_codon:yes gene_type:complete
MQAMLVDGGGYLNADFGLTGQDGIVVVARGLYHAIDAYAELVDFGIEHVALGVLGMGV